LPFWGHWEAAERTGRQRVIHNSPLMERKYNFAYPHYFTVGIDLYNKRDNRRNTSSLMCAVHIA
jgi:hypothetical protein